MKNKTEKKVNCKRKKMSLFDRIAARALTQDDENSISNILPQEIAYHFLRILKLPAPTQEEIAWWTQAYQELVKRVSGVQQQPQASQVQVSQTGSSTVQAQQVAVRPDPIKRGPYEPERFFRIRLHFANKLLEKNPVPVDQLESYTHMLFNRAYYSVRYPEKQEQYLIHLEKVISATL